MSASERVPERDGTVPIFRKAPIEGGKPAAYEIQRREHGEDIWADAAMAIVTDTTLYNQEPGKSWDYQVIAVNKAGEGPPSNIVTAVL